MAAATLIIFVAVVHRFAVGVPLLYPYFYQINLTWAQELCIYMFIWMAKFCAAYGVRTGIHVGVDVVINMLDAPWRKKVTLFALFCGALFTAIVGTMGLKFVVEEGPAKLDERLVPGQRRCGTQTEEKIVTGFCPAVAQVDEGDAAAAVESAALPQADGRVAVGLPAGGAMLGKEEIGARTELQVAAHRDAQLAAQAPGVVLEIASGPDAGLDRAVNQSGALPAILRRRPGRPHTSERQQNHDRVASRHPTSISDCLKVPVQGVMRQDAATWFPSASIRWISPRFSSRRPCSIFARSPTMTQTR
jgi:hypothetical protein